MQRLRSAAVAAILSAFVAACPAATITWSGANNITGDSNVATTGTLVASANFGPTGATSATVNGTVFTAFPIVTGSNNVTIGNVNLVETQGVLNSITQSASAAPFTNLSAGYQNLLTSAATAGVVEALQVTVSGLTVVQAFANLSGTIAAGASVVLNGGPVLDLNTTDSNGGLGQFATGTFTATAATQAFTVSGNGDFAGVGPLPFLNGFQLRSVPEPTRVLAIAGLIATGLRRRR